mmetsp:Transcript_20835/g.23800  ORF Transcript_20835/g.23800 Transcript_20835/m.23800 type:complete len:256 (-) Transcript_20835:2-769(-)
MVPNDSEQSSEVVRFSNFELQDDGDESTNRLNNSVKSSRVRFGNDESHDDDDDDEPAVDYEYGDADPKTTLATGILSHKRLRRRSLLMRMRDNTDDVLPPRGSMLKSQRVLFDDEYLSSDEEDDEEAGHFESISTDFEQPSEALSGDFSAAVETSNTKKNNKKSRKDDGFLSDGFFKSFSKFKHLPTLKALSTDTPNTIKSYNSRDYLTKEEILQMTQDDGMIDSFSHTTMILSILFLILFGLGAIGIGYVIGQK